MVDFNAYYLLTIVVIACGSIPKGYDEGGFSASTGLTSFKEDFGLVSSLWKGNESGLADRKANISSFGVLGAAFGSIIALALNDRLGRLRSWQVFIAVWMTGVLMQVFSSGALRPYLGRPRRRRSHRRRAALPLRDRAGQVARHGR
uniref:MFS quinate transporter n=1 Tax=Colletotrichum fructicola (strain Nara gc5) TaxID=1213859 RepID=L2FIL2_COLFN